jgi:hypothetical protein
VLEVHGGEGVGAAETPPRFASACACSESLRKGAVAHTTTSAIRNLLSGIFSACIRCPGGPRRADKEMIVQRAQCFECDKEPASAPSVHRDVAARRDCALAPTDSMVPQVKNRAPRGCVSKHCSCTLIICTSQAGIGAFRGV